jgi:ABC-type multidrug transport system ATPase subunit|tara:strand:+ start:178 stop:447 length:270 start_codon:yes stop_codon:yes gene_type:complete
MNKKEKKLHIGSLDSVKGFKNISLDLNTYERIFNLSQNNPLGVSLSVAKTISFLERYYNKNETNKTQKELIEKELKDVKVAKQKKLVRL